MRGANTFTEGLFTLKELRDLVPSKRHLREIRTVANKVLAEWGEIFAQVYESVRWW